MNTTSPLRLPCKPQTTNPENPNAAKRKLSSLYTLNDDRMGIFTFRSMNLDLDVNLIHDWVNKEYTKKFWGLSGTKELVYNTYKIILDHPHGHSFIGTLDGVEVCQVDCYQVLADEVGQHIENATLNDCGIHLLMAPVQKRRPGLTEFALRNFIQYFFSFSASGNLFGEPDAENIAVTRLVKKLGFVLQKQIEMSYKTANLWMLKRETFERLNVKSETTVKP